jgi:hypothetical protein
LKGAVALRLGEAAALAAQAQGAHDARAADGRGQATAGSRMASQLAFMMIEYIRRAAVPNYGAERGEIGWILEDNQGMIAIADTIESKINREYVIYQKPL